MGDGFASFAGWVRRGALPFHSPRLELLPGHTSLQGWLGSVSALGKKREGKGVERWRGVGEGYLPQAHKCLSGANQPLPTGDTL